jgi:hypothetical protein
MNAVETQLDLATRAFFAALAAVGVEAGTVVFRAHGSEPVLIARGRHADLLDAELERVDRTIADEAEAARPVAPVDLGIAGYAGPTRAPGGSQR